MTSPSFMSDEHSPTDPAERKSLDVVQRAVLSIILAFTFGSFAAVLALYLVLRGEQDLTHGDVVGLWVMSGLVGLATAAGILVINRRKPFSPWVLLGLLPMAASWYWIFH